MSHDAEMHDPPRVGVYWLRRDRALARTCSMDNGVDDGRFVDSPFDHVNNWAAIEREERSRFPGLSALEYQEVPRGASCTITTGPNSPSILFENFP